MLILSFIGRSNMNFFVSHQILHFIIFVDGILNLVVTTQVNHMLMERMYRSDERQVIKLFRDNNCLDFQVV